MGTGQCMGSWRSSRQHQHRPVQATGRRCQWVGTGLLEAKLIRPSLAPELLALCKWHRGVTYWPPPGHLPLGQLQDFSQEIPIFGKGCSSDQAEWETSCGDSIWMVKKFPELERNEVRTQATT